MWSLCSYLQAPGFNPRPISPLLKNEIDVCRVESIQVVSLSYIQPSSHLYRGETSSRRVLQNNPSLSESATSSGIWMQSQTTPLPKVQVKGKSSQSLLGDYCTGSRTQRHAEGQHKAYATLMSHSILWELNDASASCWPFTQGYASGLAYVLGAEAFKESQKNTGTNQCQAYNGL